MKRCGTSITALALAGAITLSIAPNATAQSSVGGELAGSSINAAIEEVAAPVANPVIDYLSSTATTQAGATTVLAAMPEWKAGA